MTHMDMALVTRKPKWWSRRSAWNEDIPIRWNYCVIKVVRILARVNLVGKGGNYVSQLISSTVQLSRAPDLKQKVT